MRSNTTIRGSLRIDVDEAGLEAEITFTPNSAGPGWNKAKILEKLHDRGIGYGIDEQALADFCAEPPAGGVPRSCTVARGLPAQDAEPPRPLITELSLPPELEPVFARLVPQNAPPRIFSLRTEKQKVEKIVRRRAALFFLPAREEKKTIWLRKQTAHAVRLQEVREKGRAYVRAGTTVAELKPALRPLDGMSVFGRPIPAGRDIDLDAGRDEVYLGEHLESLGGKEIKASRSGFLRWAGNWIELFPFDAHLYDLVRDPDGTTCRLDFQPGSPGCPLPDARVLLDAAKDLGFTADGLLDEAEIRGLLEQAAAEKRPLQQHSISRDLDAEIEVAVSDDKMQALLSLRKGRGNGAPLRLNDVGKAIRERGLKGLDTARVEKDVLAFFYGPELELRDYTLKEGRPATVGEAGNLIWQASFLSADRAAELNRDFQKQSAVLEALESHSLFPREEIEAMARVTERETIARLTPATPGQAGFDVFGRLVPGKLGAEPRFELHENLRLLGGEIISLSAGILEKRSADDVAHLRVREHQDCVIDVEITEDRMAATLTLLPARGTGLPLSKEAILAEIARQGVTRGIDKQLLARAIVAAREGKEVRRLCFARGTAPLLPPPGEPVFHHSLATGRSVTLRGNGKADYKQQDKLAVIEAGSLVAELPASLPGREGWTVTGSPLPAGGESEAPLRAGRNVEERREADGSSRFFATASGGLFCREGLLEVLNIYIVPGDVGLETGNIRFSGSVQVEGAVCDGFHVLATESIVVHGTVQAALLSAGESITARGGIKGGNKAVLRARRGIHAFFAEQAVLLSVGDIHLQNACLRCEIKSNGRLVLESEKGHLLGGHVRSRYGMEVRNLGSSRGSKTFVSFGQDYLLEDRIRQEEKDRRQRQESLRELELRLPTLAQSGGPEELAAARQQKLALLKLLDSRKQHIFLLREKFEEHFPGEIVVRGTAYPGAVLESHGRRCEITEKKERTVFYFNPKTGKIEEKPLEATAKETPCSPTSPIPPG
jgi:uncharacterized protein (DUF342 family)